MDRISSLIFLYWLLIGYYLISTGHSKSTSESQSGETMINSKTEKIEINSNKNTHQLKTTGVPATTDESVLVIDADDTTCDVCDDDDDHDDVDGDDDSQLDDSHATDSIHDCTSSSLDSPGHHVMSRLWNDFSSVGAIKSSGHLITTASSSTTAADKFISKK